MFELYDKVLHKPSGKVCFIIVIDDDSGTQPPIYGLETDDQTDSEWFCWADEDDIEAIVD